MLRTKQAATKAAPTIIARIEKRTKMSSPKPGLRKRGMKQRSEEHTSELQSQSNLVCRLLLEKKKTSKPLTPQPRRGLAPLSAPHACAALVHVAGGLLIAFGCTLVARPTASPTLIQLHVFRRLLLSQQGRSARKAHLQTKAWSRRTESHVPELRGAVVNSGGPLQGPPLRAHPSTADYPSVFFF